MERAPTQNNVQALVEELNERKKIDYIFKHVFAEQARKESRGEELNIHPKDFACMRLVHGWLDTECDGLLNNEYWL